MASKGSQLLGGTAIAFGLLACLSGAEEWDL